MSRILHRGLMEILRDRGALFFTIIFPSALVFILGSLLSSMDDPDYTIGRIDVLYVTESENAPLDAFLTAMSGNENLVFTQANGFTAAKQSVREGEANAAVLFTQSETPDMPTPAAGESATGTVSANASSTNAGSAKAASADANGAPFSIEIFEGRDDTKNHAVALIMESFSRRYAAISATAATAPEYLPYVPDAISAGTELLRDYDLGRSRSMMDFYAVAMIVMIIFMGSSTAAAEDIYQGRRDFTLARSLASPKGRINFYVQTQLSHIPQNMMQVVVVMLVSVLFFGAHYAAGVMDNILLFSMLFLCGMAASAVFSILGAFIRLSPTAIILPLCWVLLFFSGSFSKEVYIQGFSDHMPPYLIQQAAFELTVFGRYGQCFVAAGIAVVVFIVATVTGALLFRRKGFSV